MTKNGLDGEELKLLRETVRICLKGHAKPLLELGSEVRRELDLPSGGDLGKAAMLGLRVDNLDILFVLALAIQDGDVILGDKEAWSHMFGTRTVYIWIGE